MVLSMDRPAAYLQALCAFVPRHCSSYVAARAIRHKPLYAGVQLSHIDRELRLALCGRPNAPTVIPRTTGGLP